MFCWTEALSRELISHTCLALLRSQGVLACSLLVTVGMDVRGRKEGSKEKMSVFLLVPNSENPVMEFFFTIWSRPIQQYQFPK